MRNLLLFLSLFMNVLFFFMACSKSQTANERPSSATTGNPLERTPGSGMITAACRASPPAMTYGMVTQMINNYRNNQWMAINSYLGTSDARAACFDLDSLENFICHLKSMAATISCASLNDLAVRFYYAAYSSPAESGMPSSYSRKHTLIMIPAYKNPSGYYVDFDPALIDSVTCMPVPLGRVPASTVMKNGVVMNSTMNGGGTVFAMDHPTLTPPPPQGMAF